MKDRANVSRRTFVTAAGTTALSLGMPAIVPARGSGEGKAAASERLTLGFIGMGKQNGGHLRFFLRKAETQVLAVCDCDTTRREHARKQVDEHDAKEKSKGAALAVCKGYNDFRDLLRAGILTRW